MNTTEAIHPRWFGRRRVRTRACVFDPKRHIATFLKDALQDEGFIAETCSHDPDAVDTELIELALVAFNSVANDARETLEFLSARAFDGKVMLFGPCPSSKGTALQELGATLGLTMLPILGTPFSEAQLRTNVADMIRKSPAAPPMNADEAVRAGWLELWYQTKLDTQNLTMTGAEGLVRIRHPTWGVVPPAYFIPDEGDPGFCELSEFVIGRALEDWHRFADQGQTMRLSINIPLSFLEQPNTIRLLRDLLPDHPSFDGIIFEISGTEIISNLPFACEIANELRFYNVSVAIDDVGTEWPGLLEASAFPFCQLKIDSQFVHGMSDDKLKGIVCNQIVEFAQQKGARSIAVGVENVADFHAIRLLNVSEVQGFLFGRPAPPNKLSRALGHSHLRTS